MDHVGDMESVLERKYGEDLHVKVWGAPRAPSMFPWAAGSSGGARVHDTALSLVDALWHNFQAKMLWAKYGL